jgi:hypothetical protein
MSVAKISETKTRYLKSASHIRVTEKMLKKKLAPIDAA